MSLSIEGEFARQFRSLIDKAVLLGEVAEQPAEFARRRQAILDEFAALIGHDRQGRLARLQAEIDCVRALAGSPGRGSLSLHVMVEDRILVHENLMQLLEVETGKLCRPGPALPERSSQT